MGLHTRRLYLLALTLLLCLCLISVGIISARQGEACYASSDGQSVGVYLGPSTASLFLGVHQIPSFSLVTEISEDKSWVKIHTGWVQVVLGGGVRLSGNCPGFEFPPPGLLSTRPPTWVPPVRVTANSQTVEALQALNNQIMTRNPMPLGTPMPPPPDFPFDPTAARWDASFPDGIPDGDVTLPGVISTSGGRVVDVSELNERCSGFTTPDPDYHVLYSGRGTSTLRFSLASSGGAVGIAVREPSGYFRCGYDPDGVRFPWSPDTSNAGDYYIWLVTADPDTAISEATIRVSTVAWEPIFVQRPTRAFTSTPSPAPFPVLNPTTADWDASFPDGIPDGDVVLPGVISTSGGRVVDVSYLGEECRGFTTPDPDYHISYPASGGVTLHFSLESGSGAIGIIVQGPSGSYGCGYDPDGVQFYASLLSFSRDYYIWLVTADPDTAINEATIRITEVNE
jgi:hypothetical protein